MKIVAYIDESVHAAGVLNYAAWASSEFGAPVHVVHVVESMESISSTTMSPEAFGTMDTQDDMLREMFLRDEGSSPDLSEGYSLVRAAAERLREHGVADIHTSVQISGLVDHIKANVASEDLVILGRQGDRERRISGELGSHMGEILRLKRTPILVVPQTYRPIRRFVVAYDASPGSGRAVRFLTEHSILREAEGTIVTFGGSSPQRRHLNDAESHLRADGLTITSHHQPGHADTEIIKLAGDRDADLIVIGASGHGDLRNRIFGSTTVRVLRDSPVPVLIVN